MKASTLILVTNGRSLVFNALMAVGALLLLCGAWFMFGAGISAETAQHQRTSPAVVNVDPGLAFEGWVASHLSRSHLVKHDGGEGASHQGVVSENRLEVTLAVGSHAYPFAMECMWRNSLMGASSALGNGQLERYKRHIGENNHPIFIVLGVGGSPAAPGELYIVPAQELPEGKLTMEQLEHYKQPMTSALFYFEPYGRKLSF